MSEQSIAYRTRCRLCGSDDVRRFLHFDAMPFFNELVSAGRRGEEFLAPVDVFWCGACRSVQTQHDVNVGAHYIDYSYVASKSTFIQRFMRQLAKDVFRRFDLRRGDRVMEIGSADGFQLACFRDLGASVLGFEPAHNLSMLAQGRDIPTITEIFEGRTVGLIPSAFRPLQAVVLLHTFDHLLDPVPFLDAVRHVIDAERGVLIMEVHDLAQMVRNRETSLFGHEHATYLHLRSMMRVLTRCGFCLLDANFVPRDQMRGTSMLVAAGVQGCRHPVQVNLDVLTDGYLDDWRTYQEFAKVVYRSYDNLRHYVRTKVENGKRVAGYGAWGRGATTLAMAKLTSDDLIYVCDRNADLHGLYTPGSHIPIRPPEQVLREPVDEVIVFCHGYMSEIRQQFAMYVNSGGTLTSVLDVLTDSNSQ